MRTQFTPNPSFITGNKPSAFKTPGTARQRFGSDNSTSGSSEAGSAGKNDDSTIKKLAKDVFFPMAGLGASAAMGIWGVLGMAGLTLALPFVAKRMNLQYENGALKDIDQVTKDTRQALRPMSRGIGGLILRLPFIPEAFKRKLVRNIFRGRNQVSKIFVNLFQNKAVANMVSNAPKGFFGKLFRYGGFALLIIGELLVGRLITRGRMLGKVGKGLNIFLQSSAAANMRNQARTLMTAMLRN